MLNFIEVNTEPFITQSRTIAICAQAVSEVGDCGKTCRVVMDNGHCYELAMTYKEFMDKLKLALSQ